MWGTGGHFVESHDLGVREDVTGADCGWAQLKLKQDQAVAL